MDRPEIRKALIAIVVGAAVGAITALLANMPPDLAAAYGGLAGALVDVLRRWAEGRGVKL